MNENNNLVSGMANINGAQLYYEVKGDGPPLLLLHAGVADCRMWDAQIDAFSEQYRVIRYDMRGFGRSNMPAGSFTNYEDVRAMVDFLGIKQLSLLGISFGGLIALDFALAYPDSVSELILAAPSVSGTKPSERIRQFWEEEEAAFDKGDLEGATELNLQLWVDGPQRTADQVDPAVRELVGQMQLAIFQKDIPDDIEEVPLSPPANERLAEVKAPVLLLVGALDLEEKLTLVDRLTEEISGSQKVIIPAAAHMLNMEQPDLFNQHVLEFLHSQ